MTTVNPREIINAMVQATGVESVTDDVQGYAIDGIAPSAVVTPTDIGQIASVMAAAFESDLAVVPWGGGTRQSLGNAVKRYEVAVDLSRMNRIIAHNAGDLTATVDAGISITSLQNSLGTQGQFLALDPPLPDRATLGGTLATGVNGPLKWQYGHLRDIVIGMKVVEADGTITKSGGQVVKNVSGYDMARLHIGGLGTLGIIAEVSLKLTPLPRGEATVLAAFETGDQCHRASMAIFNSHVLPLALTAFDSESRSRTRLDCPDGAHYLAIRLGGRPRMLERQVNECISTCRDSGASSAESVSARGASVLWRKLADFGWDDSTTPDVACRAFVAPDQTNHIAGALGSIACDGMVPAVMTHVPFGTLHLHWFEGEGTSVDAMVEIVDRAREIVHAAGGQVIVDRCPTGLKSRLDVWDDVGEPIATMQRMKRLYDPKGLLNPGRFVGGI